MEGHIAVADGKRDFDSWSHALGSGTHVAMVVMYPESELRQGAEEYLRHTAARRASIPAWHRGCRLRSTPGIGGRRRHRKSRRKRVAQNTTPEPYGAGAPLFGQMLTLFHTMIFATDHDAGDRIMRSIYGKALGRHEQMRQDAHARLKFKRTEELNHADGVAGLFDISIDQVHAKPVADDRVYEHHPVWEPFRLPRVGR